MRSLVARPFASSRQPEPRGHGFGRVSTEGTLGGRSFRPRHSCGRKGRSEHDWKGVRLPLQDSWDAPAHPIVSMSPGPNASAEPAGLLLFRFGAIADRGGGRHDRAPPQHGGVRKKTQPTPYFGVDTPIFAGQPSGVLIISKTTVEGLEEAHCRCPQK